MVCIPVTNQPRHSNPKSHLFYSTTLPQLSLISIYMYNVPIDWMTATLYASKIAICIKWSPWFNALCSHQPISLFLFKANFLERVVYTHCLYTFISSQFSAFIEDLILTEITFVKELLCSSTYRSMQCPYHTSSLSSIWQFSLLEMLHSLGFWLSFSVIA